MTGQEPAEARRAIEQTLYRYAWSWDFERTSGIGSCFTEDAVGDFGSVDITAASFTVPGDEAPGLVVEGRDELVAELARRRLGDYAEDELTMHVVTNTLFRELTAEHAATTSYCLYYVKHSGEQTWQFRAGGYYDDLLVPVGGEWLIKRRRWMFGRRL